ncbi:hypothetical protein O181_015922 [Austropuccinia psidii MF-1]|uniref:Uncharacterized protein n=1 Tax=Austropuccinia psidii MF-1 TaxID=1389203 RepID=A0A9Q3C4L4_9BASI|nr:hypothetical protein [Austropuccinia psidii MF-1]
MAAAIQPGAKLGPNGHIISFMANWPPWGFYGIHAITPSNGHFMASTLFYGLRTYPAVIGLLGQFQLHQPPGLHLEFWAWWVILSSRGLQAPSPHFWIQGHPFHYWGFGLNSLYGPFRPPTASTARGVWAAVCKPGQVGPKPHFDPPEPFLATSSLDPKVTKNLMDTLLAIKPIGPNFGHGPPLNNSSTMASGNHQRPPDQLSPSFP